MESATSLSLSSSSTFRPRPVGLISTLASRQRTPSSKVVAMRGGGHREGSSVDENMIVLRMRIQEMKMSEEAGKSAPSDWMEWEKRYYGDYNEEVCKAVGALQWYLMNVRPSLGLATVVIILSSLPISTLVLMFHALHMASVSLPAFHPWW